MRLLFDLMATQPIGGSGFHGAGEYAAAVFERLVRELSGSVDLVCAVRRGSPLPRRVADILGGASSETIEVPGYGGLPGAAAGAGIDRLYSALPYLFGEGEFEGIEVVCTVHGLRPIETPTDEFERAFASSARDLMKCLFKRVFAGAYVSMKKREFEGMLRTASGLTVIVPSEYTKASLESNFPRARPRGGIHVIPSPQSPPPAPADAGILETLGLAERRFFLVTRADRWVKNPLRAVRALDRFFAGLGETGLKALVLGRADGGIFGPLEQRERFVFNGYVERDVLELLYSTALCFVFPTLDEGFGYPPIECMRYGTPVICSSATSVPEVCGDAPLYFDPRSIEGIEKALRRVAGDAGLRERMAGRGLSRAAEVTAAQERGLERIVDLILGEGER